MKSQGNSGTSLLWRCSACGLQAVVSTIQYHPWKFRKFNQKSNPLWAMKFPGPGMLPPPTRPLEKSCDAENGKAGVRSTAWSR